MPDLRRKRYRQYQIKEEKASENTTATFSTPSDRVGNTPAKTTKYNLEADTHARTVHLALGAITTA